MKDSDNGRENDQTGEGGRREGEAQRIVGWFYNRNNDGVGATGKFSRSSRPPSGSWH